MLVLFAGCASTSRIKQDAPSVKLEAFSESVIGTTFKFEMIPIPAGKNPNGGETVGPFWISKTEITWDIYDIFVFERDKEVLEWKEEPEVDAISRPSKPYIPPDLGFGHQGFAAICVAYLSAENFCKWLSARTGKKYRLPTEDEWEYACRAGTTTKYYWGDDIESIDEYVWHDSNADYQTQPVATRKPNKFGLYDMLGNAAEWCTTKDKDKPVVRGGSYYDVPEDISFDYSQTQTSEWNMTDPQVPKSKWWLSDGSFVTLRVICVPDIQED